MSAPSQPELQPGRVYRTSDFERWSANAARLAKRLVAQGELQTLAHGLFAHLKRGRFGLVPPTDDELMRAFLGGTPHVFTGPDRWNVLGLGTTAVFAAPLVYNTKRTGMFVFGNRRFLLRRVRFPESPSPEWFVVDLFEHANQAAASRHELAASLTRALGGWRVRPRPASRDEPRVRDASDAGVHRPSARSGRGVSFIHEDPDFDELLAIVAGKRGLTPELVEKDYWVTHTLWAIHACGVDIWFKGGTSLSKGFGLIDRFSEVLDLKIEPGRVGALPSVSSWKSEGAKATSERESFFTKLPAVLVVPDATCELAEIGTAWRSANVRVLYPGRRLDDLGEAMKRFVLLEIGSARVTPSVSCDMTSFVHDELEAQGKLGDYEDNRPRAVRCVHPLVTLLEKLDALQRRVLAEHVAPATFVRHFEDAARIIAEVARLPRLDGYASPLELATEMAKERQITRVTSADDPAFVVAEDERWAEIHKAHGAIQGMFWGARIELGTACETIREWITAPSWRDDARTWFDRVGARAVSHDHCMMTFAASSFGAAIPRPCQASGTNGSNEAAGIRKGHPST